MHIEKMSYGMFSNILTFTQNTDPIFYPISQKKSILLTKIIFTDRIVNTGTVNHYSKYLSES